MQCVKDFLHWQYGDREAGELWAQLQLKIPGLLGGLEVWPSLLHGDLWSGNVGEVDGVPGLVFPLCHCGYLD